MNLISAFPQDSKDPATVCGMPSMCHALWEAPSLSSLPHLLYAAIWHVFPNISCSFSSRNMVSLYSLTPLLMDGDLWLVLAKKLWARVTCTTSGGEHLIVTEKPYWTHVPSGMASPNGWEVGCPVNLGSWRTWKAWRTWKPRCLLTGMLCDQQIPFCCPGCGELGTICYYSIT